MHDRICQELLLEYGNKRQRHLPKIGFRINAKDKKEGYSCTQKGNEIFLEAHHENAALYAMQNLVDNCLSGHWRDSFGVTVPAVDLRILWLGSDCQVPLEAGMSLHIPAWLCEKECEEKVEWISRRTLELGFNTLLFGSLDSKAQHAIKEIANVEFLSLFRKYGLKVILKPYFDFQELPRSPFDPEYSKFIRKAIRENFSITSQADYFFWESQAWDDSCQDHPMTREATQGDIVKEEIQLIEKSLVNTSDLIFFFPAKDENESKQQALLLNDVITEAQEKTYFAFSSVAGPIMADHLSPHAAWQVAKQSLPRALPKLIPIFNLGSVNQGENLWPVLPFPAIDRHILTLNSTFSGVIGMVNKMPKKGALLDCSLSVAGNAIWEKKTTASSAEKWFAANRPELEYQAHSEILKEIQDIHLKLSLLCSVSNSKIRSAAFNEYCRSLAESLLAQLKWLQARFALNQKKEHKKLSLQDYFQHFSIDAKRLVSHILQSCNINLLHLRHDDDLQGGIWTHKDKKHLLDKPHAGEPHSVPARIIEEAIFF